MVRLSQILARTLTTKHLTDYPIEEGVPLSGVRVTGHFFDDYWLDETVVGQTNSNGQVTFQHVGPPCVGAIAFLVTNAEARPARTVDRTQGNSHEVRHPIALIGLGSLIMKITLYSLIAGFRPAGLILRDGSRSCLFLSVLA